MKQSLLRGKTFLYRSFLCLFSLAIGLEASFVEATVDRDDLVPTPPALLLQQEGIYDFRNRVIRCQAGEKVGIRVEAHSPLTLTNVIVEGCEVGIMVTGGTDAKKSRDSALGVPPLPSVRLENIRVRTATIGIFLSGGGGLVSDNIVGEAGYGIVVTGDDYTLTGNRSNDNSEDGFLVTGDRNILEGNEARRNKGVGIHIAKVVPMVDRRRIPFFIQDNGVGNAIRENVTLDNKRDLVEFTEFDIVCVENEWVNNIFRTREPECIE